MLHTFRHHIHHRVHYGWLVVGVTSLVVLASAAARSAPGALLHPIEADLGWSRAMLALAAALGLLCFGLVGPVAGWLVDRFGPRPVAAGGLAVVAASLLAGAAMTAPWQLHLLWGALGGIGTGATATVLSAAVASRWFVARRGLVAGVFSTANTAGQLAVIPALVTLAAAAGWRQALVSLALAALLLLPPVLLLLRNDPADLGLRPYGATSGHPDAGAPAGRGWALGALRTPTFWLIAGSFATCGITAPGLVITHFVPHTIDHGTPEPAVADAMVLMGLANVVGTLGAGWLTDRVDPRRLLVGIYAGRGLALLLLPYVAADPLGLAVFAVGFGLDYGATVPPTTALVGDAFGRRNVGAVYGWVTLVHQAGAALAAYLAGLAHGALGDYQLPFLIGGAVALAGGALALRLSPALAAAGPSGRHLPTGSPG